MFGRRIWISIAVAAALLAAGCSSDDGGRDPVSGETEDYSPLLADYSQKVVVATYADLAAKAAGLSAAAAAFAADPSNQAKLDAAASAWVSAREPWEAGEAFLFGPAAFLSLDPSIDSWPVDRGQLDNVLASGSELTPEFVSEGLGPALRGFHTIEYLLFRNGVPRTTGDVTSREREYLAAAARVLADDTAALHDEWTGGFATEFENAGGEGSRYVTQFDALLEMVEGMIAICDEVANGKIADPFDQRDSELVESQFSWNSLTDFQNNIRSVANAYTGGYHLGEDGRGLDEYVSSRDVEVDAGLKAQIQTAIDAIADIPAPFRDNLDEAGAIEAAQAAVLAILTTLEEDVKPLL
jgi:uncharacterized iron-regulated protein